MVLRENMIPCQSREAIVTVITYRDGIIDGYLQHPRLAEREHIESLSQLILLLDSLIDLEHCQNKPLPFVHLENSKPESLMVFSIQILFREHYTWQGRLVWKNEKQEYVFRSALELLQLMDEILAGYDGKNIDQNKNDNAYIEEKVGGESHEK